jgi:type II secretory pathway component PulF
MTVYEYTALDQEGRLLKGQIEAESPDDAAARLEKMSLEVREVSQASSALPGRRLARSELLLFNEQLASIVEANLPLEQALEDLAEEMDSRRLSRALRRVVRDLKSGRSLDEALEQQEQVFGRGYALTVRAGLRTGRLGSMLHSYARHSKMQQDTRNIIAASLAYPVFVLVFSLAILVLIHVVVIPALTASQLLQMDSSGLPVDATPQEGIRQSIEPLASLLTFLSFLALAFWSLKHFEKGRNLRSRILLSLPGVGGIRWRAKLAQFADLVATQIQGGRPLPDALRNAGDAVEDGWARAEAHDMASGIDRGQTPAEAGKNCKYIPSLMRRAMETASRRDSLAQCLYELSEGYYVRAQAAQEKLRIFLYPIAIVVVGFFMGMLLIQFADSFSPLSGMRGY